MFLDFQLRKQKKKKKLTSRLLTTTKNGIHDHKISDHFLWSRFDIISDHILWATKFTFFFIEQNQRPYMVAYNKRALNSKRIIFGSHGILVMENN